MDDKFILVRRQRTGKQVDSRPVIRVTPDTYDTLTHWAALTGRSITEITAKAVAFAAAHAEIIDE